MGHHFFALSDLDHQTVEEFIPGKGVYVQPVGEKRPLWRRRNTGGPGPLPSPPPRPVCDVEDEGAVDKNEAENHDNGDYDGGGNAVGGSLAGAMDDVLLSDAWHLAEDEGNEEQHVEDEQDDRRAGEDSPPPPPAPPSSGPCVLPAPVAPEVPAPQEDAAEHGALPRPRRGNFPRVDHSPFGGE